VPMTPLLLPLGERRRREKGSSERRVWIFPPSIFSKEKLFRTFISKKPLYFFFSHFLKYGFKPQTRRL